MELTLPKPVADQLLLLAAENLTPVEEFLADLVEEEDRRRHIERLPFEGEVRVKCHHELCFETRPRPTARDAEEL